MTVRIGGHRGFGCTDHDAFIHRLGVREAPAENTLESVQLAFQSGADFVEIDVVQSLDEQLLVTHSVNPGDHFFGPDTPRSPLNRLPWSTISRFEVGRYQKGRISTLDEVLNYIAKFKRQDTPFLVNIEIKGTQGAGETRDPDSFIRNIAAHVSRSGVDPRAILFSSFCLQSIVDLANILPGCRYAILFSEKAEPADCYPDSGGALSLSYLPFDRVMVAYTRAFFSSHVKNGARLTYLHPEITTVSADDCLHACKSGFALNTWALFETLNEDRRALYRTLALLSKKHSFEIGFITDSVPEMTVLKSLASSDRSARDAEVFA